MYQQQQAFQAQPLKQLREANNDDDGYYGYNNSNNNNGEDENENEEEESQLMQRSVNSKLTSTTARAEEAVTSAPIAVDKSSENITIKVGQQAVLPCFINNLGSYKVSLTPDYTDKPKKT